eukprot:362713-Chlamydomonas_euryale.AAC.4
MLAATVHPEGVRLGFSGDYPGSSAPAPRSSYVAVATLTALDLTLRREIEVTTGRRRAFFDEGWVGFGERVPGGLLNFRGSG